MEFIDKAMAKWEKLKKVAAPYLKKVSAFLRNLGNAFAIVWKYVYRLRKVFMAIPVGVGAVMLAIYNEAHLPAVVGLDLQITGDYTYQVVRELAVLGPVAVTAVCLLLMFVSRRTLTPWLVSVFTLILPVIILITNIFPA